jgi:hypothetical protein
MRRKAEMEKWRCKRGSSLSRAPIDPALRGLQTASKKQMSSGAARGAYAC